MYMFLFDDILLLSRVKKAPRKKPVIIDQSSPFARVQTDGAVFVVHRQPIALDRFVVHDVRPLDGSGGVFWDYVESTCDVCPPEDATSTDACKDSCLPHLYNDCSPSAQKSNLLFGCVSAATVLKNAFVIVQVNRFQQIIGVYTLQAPNYSSKAQWMSRLHDAQESYKEACRKSSHAKRLSRECAVDITVQCENESFMESPEERAISSPSASSFKLFNTQKVPASLLLGVPYNSGTCRTDQQQQQQHPATVNEDELTARNRKIRSSSSDAAAAMQQEELETEGGCNSHRRTSDPICQHVRSVGEASETAEGQQRSEKNEPETFESIIHVGEQSHRHPALIRTTAVPRDPSSTETMLCHPPTSNENQLNPKFHLVNQPHRVESSTLPNTHQFHSIGDMTRLHELPTTASPLRRTGDASLTNRKPFHASLKIKRKSMMKAIHEKSQSLDNSSSL